MRNGGMAVSHPGTIGSVASVVPCLGHAEPTGQVSHATDSFADGWL